MISTEQIQRARVLVGWRPSKLAHKAGLSTTTVRRIEGGGSSDESSDALTKIQLALEAAGVEFFAHANGYVGVRLRTERNDLTLRRGGIG